MAGITTPPVIVEPFGINAAPANITLPIPVASQIGTTPGAASYNDGFPPVTMEAVVAGGIPPFGQDFNGILYTVTASLAAMQAGQPWLYNADIVAAIGGYPLGTILGMADGSGLWICVGAGNVTDPDGAGSAYWAPVYSYGFSDIWLSNINVNVGPAQIRKNLIFFSGTLTGNVQVIFPLTYGEWLIINECSGPFTVSVTASGGVPLAIPAGGRGSPTGIYCDGTNMHLSVTPLAVPISITPTALSLAERDNSGYLYAQYFNQPSALENPAIGAIFIQNNAADGFLRKISPANFIAGLNLATTSAVATAIATALASYSTTAAMTAAIASAVSGLAPSANPALTGTVGVPTRAANDNSANAASTAFVQAALAAFVTFSVGGTGSANLGGFIVKWGVVAHTVAGGNQVHNFGAAFPSACFMCIPVVSDSTGVEFFSVIGNPTASGWTQYSNNTCNVRYIAIGN